MLPEVVDVNPHDPLPPDKMMAQVVPVPSINTETGPVGVPYEPLTVTETVKLWFTELGSGESLVMVVVLVDLLTVCPVVPLDEL